MIDYEEEWIFALLFRKEGSVFLRAALYAIPSALVAILLLYMDEWFPNKREELGLHEPGTGTIWNASAIMVTILVGFRTQQAFSRFWEGTGLLHQMRGEWFDTVSNCVTFSISTRKTRPDEVMRFRHTLVRLMSLCHGSALEEISGNAVKVESIDAFGLDADTLFHLTECQDVHDFNKVEVMLHLVQSLITWAQDDKVKILPTPPPILSRVYQTISRGFVNLLNAKKITDTRFPLPYAQLIAVLLYMHIFLTPCIITGTVYSKVLAASLSFIPMFGYFALNFIAAELENPFGLDDNDLPLHRFQEEMNSCLLMLLHRNTDMISSISDRAIASFDDLLDNFKHEASHRLSQFTFPDEDSCGSKGSTPPTLETRIATLQPALDKTLLDFENVLHQWTGMIEGQVSQLHQTFDALKMIHQSAAWESAVSPSP
jgi:predicted membrane chloride channel (bestrophin family)